MSDAQNVATVLPQGAGYGVGKFALLLIVSEVAQPC